jgi:acetyltransferase-like isoleucine patch superfamily enzyme
MTSWIGAALLLLRKASAYCIGRYYSARFAAAGSHLRIAHGFTCYGPGYITIGDRVSLSHHVTLYALDRYPWSNPPQQLHPSLQIGNDVFINSFTEISVAHRIVIGDGVMIAPRCFITDNAHGYRDTSRPIREQPLEILGELRIGEGTQIGSGCHIQGGLTIGKHALIGANAVVVRDIPDYCVAAGAPARVIRRFDPATGQWQRVGAPEAQDNEPDADPRQPKGTDGARA